MTDVLKFIVEHSSQFRDLALVPLGVYGAYLLRSRTVAVNQQAEAATAQAKISLNAQRHEYLQKVFSDFHHQEKRVVSAGVSHLHNIARMNPADRWLIAQLCTDFLRQNHPISGNHPEGFSASVDDKTLRDSILNFLGSTHHTLANQDEHWLNFVDLREINLKGCRLSSQRHHQTEFSRSDISGAKCDAAQFDGSYFWGANLSGSDLTGASFRGASLQGATLDNCCAHKTDFTDADLTSASFKGASLEGALLHNTCTEKADFSGCNVAFVQK